MRAFAALLLIVAFVSTIAEQKWYRTSVVCGQVHLGEEVLRDTPFVLYKSRAKHIPCCEQTDKVSDGERIGGVISQWRVEEIQVAMLLRPVNRNRSKKPLKARPFKASYRG